jgi:branched-subunit amino acid aminotransferase/4-amino-4-deoxychorismate lyase
MTASAQRSATSPLHRHKTLNYLENITARREARANDAYEALILNTDDFIAECSMSNIFFVLDGTVLTPSVESNILPGITREAVLNLCASNEIRCDERLMNFADVLFAQEVFITNSLIGVMPVREIDGKAFGKSCPGPITARLSGMYTEEILGL